MTDAQYKRFLSGLQKAVREKGRGLTPAEQHAILVECQKVDPPKVDPPKVDPPKVDPKEELRQRFLNVLRLRGHSDADALELCNKYFCEYMRNVPHFEAMLTRCEAGGEPD